MQLSLAYDEAKAVTGAVPGRALRDYQARIAGQALSFLDQGKNPLVVAATGTGKTRIGCHIVSRLSGRVLWVAHRHELVRQALEQLEHELGEHVGCEEPGRYSSDDTRVVVASKDTIRTASRIGRLGNFRPFDYVLFDECHHSAARSYQTIIEAYPNARRIGLTATPGRLDKRPLAMYDSATEPYGIVQAIDDGWLVPVHAKRVSVRSVDLSQVGTVAGDFNQHELDEVMRVEESIHGVAQGILSQVHLGPVLSFSTSVSVAERQCEVLNRYRPGIARFVSGATAKSVRHQTFADFGKAYQILVNVGVATEGTDLPAATVIAMGRPTKSVSLFQQMLGRGLRPLPGVDHAHDRASWIAASAKPKCLVLDFCSITGRHTVATAVDAITAGTGESTGWTESTRGSVSASLRDAEIDVLEALKAEAAREQARVKAREDRRQRDLARRMSLRGTSDLVMTDAQLIGLGGYESGSSQDQLSREPTPGQLNELKRLGVSGIFETVGQARQAIVTARANLELASPKQIGFLQRHAPEQVSADMTKKRARWIMSSLFKSWRRHK